MRVWFLVDSSYVYFAARVGRQPFCDALAPGEFRAGLWEKDLVEFFIRSRHSESYQEFNLSPSGAWWSALFRGVHRIDEQFSVSRNVQCYSRIDENSWSTALRARHADLGVSVDFFGAPQDIRLNVNAILGDGQKRYYSYCRLPGEHPNFHQPDEFPSVATSPLQEFTSIE